MPTKLLVTGASGFLGGAFVRYSAARGLDLRAAVRRQEQASSHGVEMVGVSEINGDTDWTTALQGVGVVVHCAARAHVLKDNSPDPLSEYRRVNVAGTISLARQAARYGVKRFIFISSIGVNGTETLVKAFTANDIEAPDSDYALSKYEAESELREISAHTGLEVVIIRPPLIYGPGAKGNLQSMIHWVKSGIPLPFGAIHNKRSLIALENLIDLMVLCLDHPLAANQTLLVSDGVDISTTELLRELADALRKRIILIPVSTSMLRVLARIAGRPELARKLLSSLQVDDSKTRNLLRWSPPVSVHEAFKQIGASDLPR